LKKNVIAFAGIFLIVLVVTGCTPAAEAPTTEPIYSVVSEGTLSAGDAIPAPDGDVILSVTGLIGTANNGDAIDMDLATIESVGLVDYTVTDPFEEKVITYRGPLMSDLLALWQVPESATTLHLVALNDYAVDVPLGDLYQYPVVFALQADGEYLPISTRGPAMLVYPYDDFEFEHSVYNDYWIWQIKSIDVQ
jgi:hypothetical protein